MISKSKVLIVSKIARNACNLLVCVLSAIKASLMLPDVSLVITGLANTQETSNRWGQTVGVKQLGSNSYESPVHFMYGYWCSRFWGQVSFCSFWSQMFWELWMSEFLLILKSDVLRGVNVRVFEHEFVNHHELVKCLAKY